MMRTEILRPETAQAYRSTFAPDAAAPADGAVLPAGWEGLLFPFDTPLADLRDDGSPARDGILPEFDLPNRRYAGEDTVYHRAVRFGDEVTQDARAGTIAEKTGRSGRLVFADVVREYRVGGELAITSTWHDVFLDVPAPGSAPPAPVPGPEWTAEWSEDAALDIRQLFRFSAITFNTHRVHYDRTWARDVEGQADLLVHGPLTRILLLDAVRRHRAGDVAEYSFRSIAPIHVDAAFRILGHDTASTTEVVALTPSGHLLARGTVTWA